MERPVYSKFPKNRNGPGYGGQNQEFRDASRRIICKLRGERYRNPGNEWLAKFIQEELFTFDYEGDRRVVRRDGAKTLTVDRRPCAARLQRSLFPSDRLARAPGRRTPLAVRPLPRGRARPGTLGGGRKSVRIASLSSLFYFAIFLDSTKRIFPDSGVPYH
jgi:hypothetical protein